MSKFRLAITGNIGFEFWAPVPEYEGYYLSSTYGRVKSVSRTCLSKNGTYRTVPEKILTPDIIKKYENVVLYKEGERKTLKVHRIVSKTFIPNFYNLPCINHRDENRSNNRVENLEWCTYEYNANYGTANDRRRDKESKPILQYDLEGNFVKEWESAKATGFHSYTHITACCKGRRKQAYGYIWKYKKNYGLL